MPNFSFVLFAAMTILVSFTLPGLIAKRMEEQKFSSEGTAGTLAQLLTPVTMQIFSTPLHLHGLDLYNRNSDLPASDRMAFIQKEYIKTTVARMSRIFPAFGIGGVINKEVRKTGNATLRSYYPSPACQ